MVVKSNIKLGSKILKDKNVIIGAKGRVAGKTIIGDKARLRSGTVVYLGVTIGNKFSSGHNAVIRESNVIGNNVVIGVNTYLGPDNHIGNNVNVQTGCFLEMTTIEDDVAIGPNVIFTNDLHPRCPRYKECVGGVTVKKGAKIGAGCVILPGVTIGERSLVGAGSVVIKDVPPGIVVAGNPAKIIKKTSELKCIKGFFKNVYDWEK